MTDNHGMQEVDKRTVIMWVKECCPLMGSCKTEDQGVSITEQVKARCSSTGNFEEKGDQVVLTVIVWVKASVLQQVHNGLGGSERTIIAWVKASVLRRITTEKRKKPGEPVIAWQVTTERGSGQVKLSLRGDITQDA